MVDFAERFGDSPARLTLIEALRRLRYELRAIGVTEWFQWVDGSFVENALLTHGHEPRDIDLVTFDYLPSGWRPDEFQQQRPEVFNWQRRHDEFSLDCYFVPLNGDSIDDVFEAFRYWRNWWSHAREGDEKGFIRLDNIPEEDEALGSWLSARSSGGFEDELS